MNESAPQKTELCDYPGIVITGSFKPPDMGARHRTQVLRTICTLNH